MVFERITSQHRLVFVVGVIAALVGIVVTALIVERTTRNDLVIVYGQGAGEIVVEVRGEVVIPGVYRLPRGARMADLLERAGGPTADADLAPVNLARRLDDGELVQIPMIDPATPIASAAQPTPSKSVQSSGIAYRINVNTATQFELEALPGIGPVIAGRIIDYRTENGPFTAPDDLLAIEGISERLLSDITPLISFGP
jgi:competence protein ComEA